MVSDDVEVFSAGSKPSYKVDPSTAQVMKEAGIDLSGYHSKSLDEIPHLVYDWVITMGCGDECPFIPANHRMDWDIPDPKGLPLDAYRAVRDQVRERVEKLVISLRLKDE